MNNLKSIIIEDEPLASELLESYISKIPLLQWIGTFHDPLKALAFLKEQNVDVVFLDLHLPKIKGFELINLLSEPPQIILTTAFHNYGVESYEYDIVDYLLKPIEFERFIKAVSRLQRPVNSNKNTLSPNEEYVFFNVNKKKVKVYYADILYLESIKGYVKIYLNNGGHLITKIGISKMEAILPKEFARIHKSFIVQLNRVTSYSAAKVEINNCTLPIGRIYQKKAIEHLGESYLS